MANGHIEIDTTINVANAKKELKELKDEVSKQTGEAEQAAAANLKKMEEEVDKTVTQMSDKAAKIDDITAKFAGLDDLDLKNQEIHMGIEEEVAYVEELKQKFEEGTVSVQEFTDELAQSKTNFSEMTAASDKLVEQMKEVGDETKLADQLKKTTAEFNKLDEKVAQSTDKIVKFKDTLRESDTESKKIPPNLDRASKAATNMTNSVNKGIGKLGRYALALFSIRSIYTMLSRLATTWMNSNDVAAQRTKAQLESITSTLSNALAPVIQFLVNLAATLVGYLSQVLKIFFGVDLASKSASKNTSGIASGVKETNKELKRMLAGFDEVDKLTSDSNDNSGGGGSGVGDISVPVPDTSKFEEWILGMAERFKPFLDILKSIDFAPLEQSFERLKKVGSATFTIIGDSITRVVNNSLGPFIKLMAENIVPKGLNTVAKVIERLNPVIDKLLKDFVEPLIHWFLTDFVPVGLNTVFSLIDALGGIVAVVIESFRIFWNTIGKKFATGTWEVLKSIFEGLQVVFDEVANAADNFLKALEEGDPVAQAIAVTIGVIVTALLAYQAAMVLINAATAIFNAISPFGWIVIAITAVIAVILVLWNHWEDIVNFFTETLESIGLWFSETWEGIKEGFTGAIDAIVEWWNGCIESIQKWWNDLKTNISKGWETIKQRARDAIQNIIDKFLAMKNFVVGFMKGIGEFWSGIINGMVSGVQKVIGNIKGIFKGLIDFIAGVFSGDWSRAWGGIVSIFTNIIDGIANIFKIPINVIIDALNFFIRQANKIKIPDWVPGIGGAGINVPEINRLQRGGVVNRPTQAIIGDGGKEAVVPLENDTRALEQMASMLSDMMGGGNSGNITIKIGEKTIVDILLSELQKRQMNSNGGVVLDIG
ncbi:hypothetical protein G7062_11255 [Erysipelothrix sp. HDW6C]|uniref:phage tail protein n=1 Tax=Erysipelothrix sp. HDW6C TaxID=2714930 RepID=UPI001409EEEA|nr:hypothetical protein [Erysipelothrix sp. HDW6C]QIK70836.1 hypothetical protein G7062_11255 [Erysipelothrix sp. HDW6C]